MAVPDNDMPRVESWRATARCTTLEDGATVDLVLPTLPSRPAAEYQAW
ncbi:hypothetical protein [Streptomyces sp. NBC_00893]|nr:hypothetical protein [Streptomyces sp. NBC_00893]MCX4850869.1 hypothetical protein [Streptomyces sp. NBC_00893]